jgi:hypothetical protein
MTKLKTVALAAVASAVIAGGGLIAAPSASAAYTCTQALAVADHYLATGDIFYAAGDYDAARYWYGRAQSVLEAAC